MHLGKSTGYPWLPVGMSREEERGGDGTTHTIMCVVLSLLSPPQAKHCGEGEGSVDDDVSSVLSSASSLCRCAVAASSHHPIVWGTHTSERA